METERAELDVPFFLFYKFFWRAFCQNVRKRGRKISKIRKIVKKHKKFSKRVFTKRFYCGKLWEKLEWVK